MGLFSKSSAGGFRKLLGKSQITGEPSSGQTSDKLPSIRRTPMQPAARIPESIFGPPSTLGGDDDSDKQSITSDASDKTIELVRPQRDGNGTLPRPRTTRASLLDDIIRSIATAQSTTQPRAGGFGAHMSSVGIGSVTEEMSELDSLLGSLEGAMKAKSRKKYKGEGFHVLHSAAANGRMFQIKALLSKGVPIDVREADGWTPLMLAAQNGHVEAVNILLDGKADINARGANGVTALFQAVLNGKPDVVQLLCERGANASLGPDDMMGVVVAAMYRGVAHSLGKDDELAPDTTSRVLRLLLQTGADPDSVDDDGDTALHLACLHDEPALVRILLDAKANPNLTNKKGRTPLANAAYESNVAMVQMLLAEGAQVDVAEINRWTPLHLATQFLKPETLSTAKLLLGAGVDVNSRTDTNATALHLAAQRGGLDILQYLIDEGALVDAQTSTGRTPLFQAVANGHTEAVDLLARAGANVNVVDSSELRLRPLHFAVVKGSAPMVERLLNLGAEVNALTGFGAQTPLKLASMRDDDESDKIFMLLLDRGATTE